MRTRVHQFFLRCDTCPKNMLVIHEFPEPTPTGWRQMLDTDRPGIVLDICPECAEKLSAAGENLPWVK